MLDSVIRASQKYYPEILLQEYKYDIKNTKMENLINDDLDKSSSNDETDNESDNEAKSDDDKLVEILRIYFNSNKSLIVYVNHALLMLILQI